MTSTIDKIALLADWPGSDHGLLPYLAKQERWQVKIFNGRYPGNLSSAQKLLIAWPQYVLVPLRVLLSRDKYAAMVCWQQAYGIVLGFLSRLFRLRRDSDVHILMFIVVPEKRKGLFFRLIDYALGAQNIKAVVSYNPEETAFYKRLFPKHSAKFISLSLCEEIPNIQRFDVEDRGYYLAAGRSNRDYDYLIDAFGQRDERLIILSDRLRVGSTPANIEVLNNVFGDDYLRLMAGAHAVIIPFKDESMSAGQLVFIHALQFGKPVIATQSQCLHGYLIGGFNGLEIRKTKEALYAAMDSLRNPDSYTELSANCVRDHATRFGFQRLSDSIFHLVQNTRARP